jgi:hypothetical protein
MAGKLWDDLHNWYAKPFRGDGTVMQWFAFVGLVLIAAWVWRSVIREIEIAIS